MAYTYDDFINAASKDGMLNSFNKYDLETAKKSPEFGLSVLSLMKDAAGAGTQEAKLLADASINNLRKTYGNYTIGEDGSYVFAGSTGSDLAELLDQSKNYGSFTYDGQSELDRLQKETTNSDPFSYDEETDPLFSSYKKTYLREGERAGANALARAAAANGGQVSTSALAASQQAQNYYGAQLADIIPTLRQNAYNEYLNGLDQKRAALEVLLTDRANKLNDWQTGFNILQTNIDNLKAKNAEEYTEYQDRETLANNAINNALALYQTLGYATPEIAAVLGIPEGTVYPVSGGSGTKSGTSTGSTNYSGNGAASMEDVAGLQAYLNTFGAGLTEDGKYGDLSAAAVREIAGQDLNAEEAVNLWKQGLLKDTGTIGSGLVSGGTNAINSGTNIDFLIDQGYTFDKNSLIAIAANGYNTEKIDKALTGDETLSGPLVEWLDQQISSGKLLPVPDSTSKKIKFQWKV